MFGQAIVQKSALSIRLRGAIIKNAITSQKRHQGIEIAQCRAMDCNVIHDATFRAATRPPLRRTGRSRSMHFYRRNPHALSRGAAHCDPRYAPVGGSAAAAYRPKSPAGLRTEDDGIPRHAPAWHQRAPVLPKLGCIFTGGDGARTAGSLRCGIRADELDSVPAGYRALKSLPGLDYMT